MTDPDATRWLHRHSELGYTSDPRQAVPHEPAAFETADLIKVAFDEGQR